MSAPALIGCVAAALCLGVPVLAAGSHLDAAQQVTGAADAAALAAADTLTGWITGEPCDAAAEIARSVGASMKRCDTNAGLGEARVTLTKRTPIGTVTARSRAGGAPAGETTPGAWTWPASVGGVAQGFHDGLAVDLAAPLGSALFAPYDAVIVTAGPDGGGIPGACRANPAWWRGENETVIMRHDYDGRTIYSSHNHVQPGSTSRLGLTAGSRVRAGQPVAIAGMSGCTSGPHSHFTLATRPENAFPNLNPFSFLGQP